MRSSSDASIFPIVGTLWYSSVLNIVGFLDLFAYVLLHNNGYYMFVFISVYRQNKHAKISMGYIKRTYSIFVYTVILIVIY
jgi:hypothetical protein